METMELVPIAGSLHEAFFEWDVMRDFMIKRCVEFYKAEKRGKVKTRKGRKPPSRMVRYVMGLLEKAFLWAVLLGFLYNIFTFGRWVLGI